MQFIVNIKLRESIGKRTITPKQFTNHALQTNTNNSEGL